MKKIMLSLLGIFMILFTGCGEKNEEKVDDKQLTVYCPHPLEFIDPLVKEFENETGVSVEVIAAGTGELMKRIESEKDNPLADVLWGGTITTVEPIKECFLPYTSKNESAFYDRYKNKEGNMTRFTAVPSVIMVNSNLIGDIKIEGYEDLLNPALKGKIAFSDPAKSSSSFEHLVNMLYAIADVIFPIEKNIEFVKEIKKRGYKLYILSNFHKKAFRRIERLYNLDSIFDGKIVSFEVNLLKPEKEIYEVLLGKYSLNPDETIFIDDTFENIVAAKKIGIKGIELKDFNELENILKGACSL